MLRPEPLIRFVLAEFDASTGHISQTSEEQDADQQIAETKPLQVFDGSSRLTRSGGNFRALALRGQRACPGP